MDDAESDEMDDESTAENDSVPGFGIAAALVALLAAAGIARRTD